MGLIKEFVYIEKRTILSSLSNIMILIWFLILRDGNYYLNLMLKIQNKTHANSFYKTDLSEQLRKLNINKLEICGAQTEYCVDTTIRMAHGLGYTLFMKKGLTTTLNNDLLGAKTIIEHHENLWNHRFLTFL